MLHQLRYEGLGDKADWETAMVKTNSIALFAATIWLVGFGLCAATDQPIQVQIVDALNNF